MLLAFLQLRDAKNVGAGTKRGIKENQNAVKLIDPVDDTQYVVPCTCDHLGIMTRPLFIGIYLRLFSSNISPAG